MSSWTFSAPVFSLVLGYGYAIAVYINYPLFRYFPLVKQFTMHEITDKSFGPAMYYYGWIAIAAIPALLLSIVVPKRLGDRIPLAAFWILPFVMLLSGWYRDRSWFQ